MLTAFPVMCNFGRPAPRAAVGVEKEEIGVLLTSSQRGWGVLGIVEKAAAGHELWA